ncbi:MAG: hypothetical protein ACRCZB_07580, partial [Bacteroidales bacterium]
MSKRKQQEALTKYDEKHLSYLQQYRKAIAEAYRKAIAEASIASMLVNNFDDNNPLDLSKHKAASKKIDKAIESLTNNINVVVTNGIASEW